MERTGNHVQQIKRYEANTSQPSADALKKIAKLRIPAIVTSDSGRS